MRRSVPRRHAVEHIDPFASLFHDLKQPLAAILLLADGLAEPDGSIDPRLDLIRREAQFMVDAVQELLDRQFALSGPESDICSVVDEAVARAQPTTTSRLLVRLDSERCVAISPTALGRAVSCLLDNAIRASAGAPITTIVRDRPMCTEIVVIDQGAGLGRVGAVHGLGHRIVRSLIGPAGGELTLSPGIVEGAVATLTIPSISTSSQLEHVS